MQSLWRIHPSIRPAAGGFQSSSYAKPQPFLPDSPPFHGDEELRRLSGQVCHVFALHLHLPSASPVFSNILRTHCTSRWNMFQLIFCLPKWVNFQLKSIFAILSSELTYLCLNDSSVSGKKRGEKKQQSPKKKSAELLFMKIKEKVWMFTSKNINKRGDARDFFTALTPDVLAN